MMHRKGNKSQKIPKQITEDPPVVEPEVTTPEVIDEYADLRHKSLTDPPKPFVFTPKTKRVNVYKKKRSLIKSIEFCRSSDNRTSKKQKKANIFDYLNEDVVVPEMPKVWTTPIDVFIAPKLIEVIPKPQKEKENYIAKIDASLLKESKCLELYKKTKLREVEMENECMKGSSKTRGSLLLRRHMVLPRISSKSQEQSVVPVERCETPECFPSKALFARSIYGINEKNGIRGQLTKRQQGYRVVTDWIGCPEITDEIRDHLGLNTEHALSCLKQNFTEPALPHLQDGHSLPSFTRLGVLGFNYKKLQAQLKLPKSETVELGKSNTESMQDSQTSLSQSDVGESTLGNNMICPSQVSLSIAHVNLYWSSDQQICKKPQVVELGCSAEMNEKAIEWVVMKNTGTAAIHYNWVKKERTNEFRKERCDQMRMVFDSWGGVILPGEVYRIPFMYKALTPGHFSEEWQLLTQPLLNNGAEVILRLWGFTRKCSPLLTTWEEIEQKIMNNIKWSVVRHRMDKIIDFLPLREDDLADDCYPLILLGPDLFISINPWLYYNSANVYRLGMISKLVEEEQRRTGNITVPDLLSAMFLYEDGEEGEEEMIGEEEGKEDMINEEEDIVNEENEAEEMDIQEIESQMSKKEAHQSEMFENFSVAVSMMVEKLRKDIDLNNSVLMVTSNSLVADDRAEEKEEEEEHQQQNNPEEFENAESHDDSLVSSTLSKPEQHKKSVTNLVDPNVDVQQLRTNLLQCDTDLIKQEALFTLMSEEVDKLLFKPYYPAENWKIPVCNGLLAKALDEFSDYAENLRCVCCHAEYLYQLNIHKLHEEESEHHSFVSPEVEIKKEDMETGDANNANDLGEGELSSPDVLDETLVPPEINETLSEPASDEQTVTRGFSLFLDQCPVSDPRTMFGDERYEEQYYSCLYTRMYWLLCDVFDQIDTFIWKPQVLDSHYGKDLFIKLKSISFNVNIEHELNKPLPPKWVEIAERMDKTRTGNRLRKEAVEELDIQLREEHKIEAEKNAAKTNKKNA